MTLKNIHCCYMWFHVNKKSHWSSTKKKGTEKVTEFYIWNVYVDMKSNIHVHVHVYSAWNSFWKCPAEILGQNNIWPSSCEFSSEKASLMNLHCTHLWLTRYRSDLLGHDCSWLIINFTMRLLMSLPIFCFIIRKFVQ